MDFTDWSKIKKERNDFARYIFKYHCSKKIYKLVKKEKVIKKIVKRIKKISLLFNELNIFNESNSKNNDSSLPIKQLEEYNKEVLSLLLLCKVIVFDTVFDTVDITKEDILHKCKTILDKGEDFKTLDDQLRKFYCNQAYV